MQDWNLPGDDKKERVDNDLLASENEGSTCSTDATDIFTASSRSQKRSHATSKDGGKSFWKYALLAIMLILSGFSYVWCLTSKGPIAEAEFKSYATHVASRSRQDLLDILAELRIISVHVTSNALEKGSNWPLYTWQHEFESHSHNLLDESAIQLIAIAPIVYEENRHDWEIYSVKNQNWIHQGFNWSFEVAAEEGLAEEDGELLEIPGRIFRYQDRQQVGEYTTGPYLPLWQYSNAHRDPTHVNFNLLSNPDFANAFYTAKRNRHAVISEALDVFEIFGKQAIDGEDERESVLIYPIFRSLTSKSEVVGVVIAVIPWESFLLVTSGGTSKGVVCVFRSSCGQTFTYEVEGGNVHYIGGGDLHDDKYDFYEYRYDFGPLVDFDESDNAADEKYSKCDQHLHIYPSDKFYAAFVDKEIDLFGLLVSLTFVLACVIVLFHDAVMMLRERKLERSAFRAQAVISSLFPDGMQNQIFQNSIGENGMFDIDGMHNMSKRDERVSLDKLKETESGEISSRQPTSADGLLLYEDKPIANYFAKTTVMFADIEGFTSWSSEREPGQVFQLLETVYSAFDAIAKNRGVYKVETIGDCYIAVTGLPEPQDAHAVIMAQFARECIARLNELVRELEGVLGPGTAELGMRFGVHSGPVTAGVLRGQRARFQLYGDTVSFAARLESSGMKNRIQVSQDTAELLVQAGKSAWLKPREDKANPLQETFWLAPKRGLLSEDNSTSTGRDLEAKDKNCSEQRSNRNEEVSPKGTEAVIEKKRLANARQLDRLVFWHVEVLSKYLKRIVANRKALDKTPGSKGIVEQCEIDILDESSVLDEVIDVIKFPTFNVRTSEKWIDPATIELKPEVISQLREYVRVICTKYRNNAFHNFEHASHVVMSIEKFLSRIISSDEENNASLHECTFGLTSDPLAQFTIIFCALVHDVDHRGVSNSQLVEKKQRVATLYRNKCVQEQNSMNIAWMLLMEERFIDLRRCIYSDRTELFHFRQILVNSVIATDFFDKDLLEVRNKKWQKAFATNLHLGSNSNHKEDAQTNCKATVVIEYMIQAADVAHTMQHFHVFLKWNEKLFEENFCASYQHGRAIRDPANDWYRNELAFFDDTVVPLAKKLSECGVFGISSDEYLLCAIANREEWKKKGEQCVISMIENLRKQGKLHD